MSISSKLTSLVPSEASMFSDRMRRGEDAFKTNDYLRAISAFKLASDISADDWTSSLSLVHCYFAINTMSYSSSAHHLREALAHFPEMTALSIQPKEFFGDRSKYADALRRLEAHGGIGKSGADSRLVLAYFRWFDQQPEEAHKALAQALAFAIESGDSDNKEAIQAFWKGMVTSGKVSGELEPASLKAATQPADSAKPAEAKPAETTQSPEPLKPTEVEKPAAAKGKVTSQPAQSSDSPTS